MSRRKCDAEELNRLQLQIKAATNAEEIASGVAALKQMCMQMHSNGAYLDEKDIDIQNCLTKTEQEINHLKTYDITRKQLCEFTVQALIDALLYDVPYGEVATD